MCVRERGRGREGESVCVRERMRERQEFVRATESVCEDRQMRLDR